MRKGDGLGIIIMMAAASRGKPSLPYLSQSLSIMLSVDSVWYRKSTQCSVDFNYWLTAVLFIVLYFNFSSIKS
jgi:hypothetical protein